MKKSSSGSDESSSDSESNRSNQDDKMIEQIEAVVERKQKAIIMQNVTISPIKPKLPTELEKIPIKIGMDLSESKYDVYLLRIPRTIDRNLLVNQNLKLHKPCKLKLDKKYIFQSTSANPDPALVVFDDSKIINFKSNTIISEYIKERVLPELEVPEKGIIELPENLKIRHPLFGPNFDQKIQLSEVVEQKLNDAKKNILNKNLKEKKKKKQKRQLEVSEQCDEVIYSLLNSTKSNKSPKKRRLNSEFSDDSAFSSGDSTMQILNNSKKHKKRS